MSRTRWAVILGFILFGASDARAAVWAVTGAGCTPTDFAIQGNRYIVFDGAVALRTGDPTYATLHCPITTAPPDCPSGYRLRLTYMDGDGLGFLASVTARLQRRSQLDGVFVAMPGTQVSSNFSNVTSRTSLVSLVFVHDFSQFSDYYSVRVDMNRPFASNQLANFYGVALECAE